MTTENIDKIAKAIIYFFSNIQLPKILSARDTNAQNR